MGILRKILKLLVILGVFILIKNSIAKWYEITNPKTGDVVVYKITKDFVIKTSLREEVVRDNNTKYIFKNIGTFPYTHKPVPLALNKNDRAKEIDGIYFTWIMNPDDPKIKEEKNNRRKVHVKIRKPDLKRTFQSKDELERLNVNPELAKIASDFFKMDCYALKYVYGDRDYEYRKTITCLWEDEKERLPIVHLDFIFSGDHDYKDELELQDALKYELNERKFSVYQFQTHSSDLGVDIDFNVDAEYIDGWQNYYRRIYEDINIYNVSPIKHPK